MSAFLSGLLSHKGKRVSLEDVRRHFYAAYPEVQDSPERGAALLRHLEQLQQEGHISLPARASWERIGSPPLPKWVGLAARAEPAAPPRQLQDVAWAPELDFWPQLRPAQLEALLPVNDFLLRRRGLTTLIPAKERSLEIFGDEKRLEQMCDGHGGKLLGRVPLSVLGCFQVAAPLPYRPAAAPGRPVLVVENKDSYWSFGEWNASRQLYAAVVYGAGESFQRTGSALAQVLHEVGGTEAHYFGDLDTKGVRIPLDFNVKATVGSPLVLPAAALYEWTLSHGTQRRKAECAEFTPGLGTRWLGERVGAVLEQLWSRGMWIPQEALNYERLLDGAAG